MRQATNALSEDGDCHLKAPAGRIPQALAKKHEGLIACADARSDIGDYGDRATLSTAGEVPSIERGVGRLNMSDLIGLFWAAFFSATLLPGGSELVFVTLLVAEPAKLWVLLAVATLGNTLGSGVNWTCGRFLMQFSDRRWFPASAGQVERAERHFKRWGLPALLFAWLPVVGDALTVIAGVLRVSVPSFFLLVGLGKLLRYSFVAWATLSWAD